eukprot:3982934-Amphidinium_carterae.1
MYVIEVALILVRKEGGRQCAYPKTLMCCTRLHALRRFWLHEREDATCGGTWSLSPSTIMQILTVTADSA